MQLESVDGRVFGDDGALLFLAGGHSSERDNNEKPDNLAHGPTAYAVHNTLSSNRCCRGSSAEQISGERCLSTAVVVPGRGARWRSQPPAGMESIQKSM